MNLFQLPETVTLTQICHFDTSLQAVTDSARDEFVLKWRVEVRVTQNDKIHDIFVSKKNLKIQKFSYLIVKFKIFDTFELKKKIIVNFISKSG